ncbi:MAG: iron-containing alcohol dehydrogenase [Rhodoferax sp.]|jgi:hydroxyacid-oxoacid transhydrogenase|uniref:hydroxyacid-oxoacid transhydrogenase n=1 Tax=Rhodoferax sp. TaxID=50421 RepID=UPI001B78A507|nr:hydroxyacid-oxoacid transhydrogenase [Rhodoferax sp.]MBP9148588.1 iron-containing alcohol dehydrogenase [Rhodoferax sp.]MBP9735950.1 iron-containing alcohol dehydrogenase [Rhodoferax sp.]
MTCCHNYFAATEGFESIFSVDIASISFGPGVLREAGEQALALGMTRVALLTDKTLMALPYVTQVGDSLKASGIDVVVYDEVKVEPTDQSFLAAARFAAEGRFDGYVSVGGGSVIDTCKAANLYATWPSADFLDYVNPPIGAGKPVPGPLKPHIACPTTCGTGSECTGITIFDLLSMQVKTGIASKRLRPSLALIDPSTTYSLPKNVVAASGFDVLSHALESYTTKPYTRRLAPAKPGLRPMSQGANPWSDLGCEAALRLLGQYLVRAVNDASDHEARDQMMYAATLAGIAFGNSGVHIPHGMAYSVAGLVRDFYPEGYPQHEPMVPHGMSVIVNAPSVFRFTACACPERHIHAAACLGAHTQGASAQDAGEIVAAQLIRMMQATGIPNGVGGVGYGEADVPQLTKGAWAQQRLLTNAPRDVSQADLSQLYRDAMQYW